ncbi:MAG TPA: hypothetical protein DCZ10_12505 [Pelotomaculum sp.]|jgi:hypothetical protein|nr:hypothetical protein [Pelotomaculum sp.]
MQNAAEASDGRVYDPASELPYILKTEDVAKMLSVCNATALKEIRNAEKKGVLVRWIGKGNQPRVNRDSFCAYLESKPRRSI